MPMQDHIIVIHAMPEMQIDGDRAILGKHTFHNFDMEWECECGNIMEPDAHICGECRAKNPFLGILI